MVPICSSAPAPASPSQPGAYLCSPHAHRGWPRRWPLCEAYHNDFFAAELLFLSRALELSRRCRAAPVLRVYALRLVAQRCRTSTIDRASASTNPTLARYVSTLARIRVCANACGSWRLLPADGLRLRVWHTQGGANTWLTRYTTHTCTWDQS